MRHKEQEHEVIICSGESFDIPVSIGLCFGMFDTICIGK